MKGYALRSGKKNAMLKLFSKKITLIGDFRPHMIKKLKAISLLPATMVQ